MSSLFWRDVRTNFSRSNENAVMALILVMLRYLTGQAHSYSIHGYGYVTISD